MTVTAESITAERIIVEALASGMAKYAHRHFTRALDAGVEPLLALELFLRERLSAADYRTALDYFNASTSAIVTAFDEAVGHVPAGE